MSVVRHSIRQQTLELHIDSEALALALQPHIGDINRRRLLPAIERVLDEFDVPAQHIRIARLDVDLGDLPAGNFEQAAEEALYPALRRAIADALRKARDHPSSDHEIRPEASSQLAAIEHYLLGGTLPFWARTEEFSVESLLLQVAVSDPASLVAMLRRHARDRHVLERLAFQIDTAALEALLRLFSPEHAALILTYMVELRQIHRIAPLLVLSETAFAHLLWVLVLSYLLNDPGSQFNRKSFVRSFLEGVAESAGLDYRDLVETLWHGVYATQQRHSLISSLPAIVLELRRELRAGGQRTDASPSDTAPIGDLAGELDLPAEEILIDDADGLEDEVLATLREETASAVPHLIPDGGWSDSDGQDRVKAVRDRAVEFYDQIEILRYYLRHGLLPWNALLRDAALSVEGARVSLVDLSAAQLRLLFAGSPEEQSYLVESALRQLPEDRIVAVLASLLPQVSSDTPFASVLTTFAAQASDRPAFYARVITTLLEHAPLDLGKAAAEARPSPVPETIRSEFPESWETGTLKSLLASRLRFGATVWPEAPASGEVLQALVARHGGEARYFLEAVADAPPLRRALVQQVPVPLLRSLFDRLYPDGPSALRAFMDRETPDTAPDHIEPAASGTSAALQEMVFAWLRDGVPSSSRDRDRADVPALTDDSLVYALERMIATAPEHVAPFIRQYGSDRKRRARWADLMPDSALARLTYLLAPRQHSVVLAAADILMTAWREAAPPGQRPIADRTLLWNFLLDMTVAHGDIDLSRSGLVAAFFARTASTDPRLATRLLHHALRLAEAAGNKGLLSVLQRDGRILRTGRDYAAKSAESRSRPAARPRTDPRNADFHSRPDDKDVRGETIYISNAGLILTGPFLPHLLQVLDVLVRDDNGRQHVRDYHAASRAVHLLQYLVDGRTDAPEPLLVLNKILCGTPVWAPIARAIEPTDAERA
ncbi:MAG: hypothetical protein QOD94_1665, partial [Alphaproteobacteria bacterium]|nr:hypothetical protein [Alphaproteobacteria bacterium]